MLILQLVFMGFPGKSQSANWIKAQHKQRCRGSLGSRRVVSGRIKREAPSHCSSNSLLIHRLTALLLCTAEGNPAHPIQNTQIPLLAFFFCFIFSIKTHTHTHARTHIHTTPSLFLQPPLHPPVILQGSG